MQRRTIKRPISARRSVRSSRTQLPAPFSGCAVRRRSTCRRPVHSIDQRVFPATQDQYANARTDRGDDGPCQRASGFGLELSGSRAHGGAK